MNASRKFKKNYLINSSLSLKNRNISQILKIAIKINFKVPNKISIIKRNKDSNKENIKRKLDFYNLIMLLLITSILNLSYQNSLIYQDSEITLKVSGGSRQKIFGNSSYFTKPNEVWIDTNNISPVAIIQNNLNSTNIIKLLWKTDITGCKFMFHGCNKITEINFTNFDATKCESTDNMLMGCYSLISVDLSGFFTSSQLKNMADMFNGCKSLISVDFSNFNTSEAISFGHMFSNCESLVWINFPNIITDKIEKLDNMFYGCKNLTSINLSNFYTTNLEKIQNMFDGCESLKIIDFPNLYLKNVNEDNLKDVFKNCPKLEYINIKNFGANPNLEYLFFDGIPNNLIICIDNIELINKIIEKNKCILISCKGNSQGFEYALNKENGCLAENCTSTHYKYEFKGRCYEVCPANSKRRENIEELKGLLPADNFFCKPICNETFPFEVISKQECVMNCDITSITNELCILNYDKAGNTFIFDTLLKNAEDFFISEDYNTSLIEKGYNEVFTYKELTITLTSIKNQKNDENKNNVSTINIGECEKLLKQAYNIPNNETLFIKKIDVKEEGMNIPKIEFDVYYKLNGKNLVKLNLSHCYDIKIDISIPLEINEPLDKYNSSSGYYNDICYTTTSEDGTDITLKDRKKKFIDDNKTLCQENCFLSEYNYNINKAKCSCDVVESSTKFIDIKIDKSKLYKNFIDIKNIANINLLVCYKKLFSKIGIIKNCGNYSMFLIIITHFIIIIIYYSKKLYIQIQNIINKISFNYDNLVLLRLSNKEHKCLIKRKFKRKSKKRSEKNKVNIKNDDKNNPPIKKSRKINKNLKYQIEETTKSSKMHSIFKNKSKSIKINKKLKHLKNIIAFNDEELNNLEYVLALRYDKRNYCEYYYSLLKTKHVLLFTFFNNTDYNLKIIKIDLFIFNFALSYVINGLFFNDDTMHKIYKNKGDFDIFGQLPQIIYSFIISSLFSFLLEMLALTEGSILELKQIKEKIGFNQKIIDLVKIIKIKFIIYFIISSVFILFFWYYLSMFCAIYTNTQIHLLKDTLLSFVLSFIEPFGIYLIPGLFRIPSLAKKYNNRNTMYKFSLILQNILI